MKSIYLTSLTLLLLSSCSGGLEERPLPTVNSLNDESVAQSSDFIFYSTDFEIPFERDNLAHISNEVYYKMENTEKNEFYKTTCLKTVEYAETLYSIAKNRCNPNLGAVEPEVSDMKLVSDMVNETQEKLDNELSALGPKASNCSVEVSNSLEKVSVSEFVKRIKDSVVDEKSEAYCPNSSLEDLLVERYENLNGLGFNVEKRKYIKVNFEMNSFKNVDAIGYIGFDIKKGEDESIPESCLSYMKGIKEMSDALNNCLFPRTSDSSRIGLGKIGSIHSNFQRTELEFNADEARCSVVTKDGRTEYDLISNYMMHYSLASDAVCRRNL